MPQAPSPEAQKRKRDYYLENKCRILAARKKRYEENRERLKAKQREFHRTHPLTEAQKQAARKRSATHYQRNRLEIAARVKQYQASHPEILKKASVKYLSQNREKLRRRSRDFYYSDLDRQRTIARAKSSARRAKQKCSPEELRSIQNWMEEVRGKPFMRCHWCGTKVSGSAIHFDHVVALANNGTHSIGNLCVSCSDCNHSKSARAIADWIVSGQTFLSL